MDFAGAIKDAFVRYVRFDGVSSRSAFWYWRLFVALVSMVGNIIAPISVLVTIALVLPDTAVGIRRSRDAGFSAWFQLLWLLPVAAFIWRWNDVVVALQNTSIDLETATDEQLVDYVTQVAPPVLEAIAPGFVLLGLISLFFLVTWLLPTKTAAQGNRLVKQ